MNKTLWGILLALAIIVSIFGIWLNVTAQDVDVYSPVEINHPKTPKEVVYHVFKKNPALMMRILDAETNPDCDSVRYKNPDSTAKGCFQILDSTWKGEKCKGTDHYDFRANIFCAKILFDRYGTTPWNESKANWQ
jgi:hypothetical protein